MQPRLTYAAHQGAVAVFSGPWESRLNSRLYRKHSCLHQEDWVLKKSTSNHLIADVRFRETSPNITNYYDSGLGQVTLVREFTYRYYQCSNIRGLAPIAASLHCVTGPLSTCMVFPNDQSSLKLETREALRTYGFSSPVLNCV